MWHRGHAASSVFSCGALHFGPGAPIRCVGVAERKRLSTKNDRTYTSARRTAVREQAGKDVAEGGRLHHRFSSH